MVDGQHVHIHEDIRDEIATLEAIYGERIETSYPTTLSADVTVQCTVLVGGDADDQLKPNTHRLVLWFPQGYPEEAPIRAKITSIQRSSQATAALAALSTDLHAYISELGLGIPCAFDVVCWVTEALSKLPALEPQPVPREGTAIESGLGLRPSPDSEGELERQWIYFIGFYTKSIRAEFCQAAASIGCTGFLMPGKPAVAAVEGTRQQIDRFLYTTRTETFAQVAPSMRKMQVTLLDRDVERVFEGFDELVMAHGGHKRKDISDLSSLQKMLEEKGIGHAFEFIFNANTK